MADNTPSVPVTPPVEAVLCVRCGYNLHTLDLAGHCPECGLGVGRSMVLGRELADSRPGWIQNLSLACWLLVAANLLLLGVMGVVILEMWGSPWRWDYNWPVRQLMLLGPVVVAAVTHLLGAWVLTRPENRYAAHQPGRVSAWALRLTSLLLVAIPGLVTVAIHRQLLWSSWAFSWNRWLDPEVLSDTAIYGAALPLCVALECFILRRLGRRVLSNRLTEYAAIIGWGYALTWLFVVVLPLWVWLASPDIQHLALLLSYVGICFFWIASVIMMAGFAVAFSRAARRARDAWRQADAAA